MAKPYPDPNHGILIIAMGVSGTGKSTLGQALAKSLDMPFKDGDELHPQANIDKMSAGHPLTDADREPWLELIRTTAESLTVEQHHDSASSSRSGVVIACSALKKYYRDILRGTARPGSVPEHLDPPQPRVLPTYFVFIRGSRDMLVDRMSKRSGHFMKVDMLDSQLNTLEDPEGEEGVIVVSAEDSTEEQVRKARAGLEALIAGSL
ncbi:hypothetical protein PLICRDRAFT_50969 [Plicaturopsis crispa FD-325 SS-3]|nr:hypothetical protein PLICRDRAFT_50969 [Plicaturopsis crispa FD-325 SS-3]